MTRELSVIELALLCESGNVRVTVLQTEGFFLNLFRLRQYTDSFALMVSSIMIQVATETQREPDVAAIYVAIIRAF